MSVCRGTQFRADWEGRTPATLNHPFPILPQSVSPDPPSICVHQSPNPWFPASHRVGIVSRMVRQLQLASVVVATVLVGSASGDTLIRNVGIVDVTAGKVVADRDVLIRDTTIDRIDRSGALDAPEGARVIDGTGLYLMPGLFDAHVHITAGAGSFESQLLAHGVTAVRDTGAATAMIVNMRASALSGELLAPELFVTGAIIDGSPPVWPFSEVCETAEDGRAAVDRLADLGVDQIKVYTRLPEEAWRAVIERARERELRVTGHVPSAVTLHDAIEAGQDCIEHFDGFAPLLLSLAPPDEVDAPQRGGVFAGLRGWTRYRDVDPTRLDETLRMLAEAEIMQCPTLAVWRGLATLAGDDAEDDPRLEQIPAFLRQMWTQPGYRAYAGAVTPIIPAKHDLLRRMHEHGVPLMIGTDLGNPFVFPGSSVHEEMLAFQAAGIPTVDVLRMATIVPARFCGVDDRLGTVEVGKTASLLLVRSDPLTDIRHVGEIEAVVLRGRVLDGAELDRLRSGTTPAPPTPEPESTDAADDEWTVSMELPGTITHSGTHRLRFEQWAAGQERFAISRDDRSRERGATHAAGHIMPSTAAYPESFTKVVLDESGAFASAIWRQRGTPGSEAEYRLDGRTLMVRGRRGDGEWEHAELTLPENAFISTPVTVADGLMLMRLRLAVGDVRDVTLVGFGNSGWRPESIAATIERLDDETIVVADDSVPTQRLRTTMRFPAGELRSTVWIDADGLVRRYATELGTGTLTGTLELD